MDEIDYALNEISHGSFALPILPLQYGHADISSLVYVDVQERLLKLYHWTHSRVLLGEGDLNRVYSALPECPCCAWYP